MPMIDVDLPEGLVPVAAHARLAGDLARALLRAEGAPDASPYAENTGVYLHVQPRTAVHTAAQAEAPVVRVQVLTPPGALDREGQRGLVAEATRLVSEAGGDPSLAGRTWVLLREAAEGGWGVFGSAFGREEFAALRAGAAGAAAATP